jgi:hypothetical protein
MPSRKQGARIEAMARDFDAELDAIVRKDLRDEFAKAALIGVINQSTIAEVASTIMAVAAANGVTEHDVIARAAYRYADAMLREREKATT